MKAHGSVQMFVCMLVHASNGMQLGKLQITFMHTFISFSPSVLSLVGRKKDDCVSR